MRLREYRTMTPPQAAAIAELAGLIWREHYTPIIGAEQVEYMLCKYQSAEQIRADAAQHGFRYFTAEEAQSGELVGYCAGQPQKDCLLISKLYVRKDRRGLGIARAFMEEMLTLCRSEYGLGKLRLTVNKHNDASIAAYRKMGFETTASVKVDIGGGFFMDDFIMERDVL